MGSLGIACPILPDPAGGQILTRTIDNNGQMMGFVELRCDEGYTVIGVSTAVCLPVVNRWNRAIGTCEGGNVNIVCLFCSFIEKKKD